MQIKKWVLGVIAGIIALTGGATGGLAVYFAIGTPEIVVTQQGSNLTATVQPEEVDFDNPDAAELVPGSPGTEYDRAYQCTEDYTTVQVPVGETDQMDGTTYKLTEQRKQYVNEQQGVVLQITTTKGVPVMIIDTAAHQQRPDLYPQHLRPIALEPGGRGEYTLATDEFSKNYNHIGITSVTLCLTK